MPSCNTYRLTWVSLTLDVGYLFTAAPEKCSRCSLSWTRGISSRGPSWPWTWSSSSWPSLRSSGVGWLVYKFPLSEFGFFRLGTRGLYSITHMLQSIFQKKKSMHPALYVIQPLSTISHVVVCICQYYVLNSSHPPLHLLSPQVHSLHLPLYSNLIIFLTSDNCHWINSSNWKEWIKSYAQF